MHVTSVAAALVLAGVVVGHARQSEAGNLNAQYSEARKPAPSATSFGNIAPATQNVPFTRLHNGVHSGFTRLSEFVIRDQDEFARRWRGVQQGSPDVALPVMDFEKNTVVFVAMGSRNTGGYSVRIDSITSGTNTAKSGAATTHYTVFYTTTSPGARCMSLQELTSPLDVISIEGATGEVKFKKRGVKSGC